MFPTTKKVAVPLQRKQLVREAVDRLRNKQHGNPHEAALFIWKTCWQITHPKDPVGESLSQEQCDFIHNLRRTIVLEQKLKASLTKVFDT